MRRDEVLARLRSEMPDLRARYHVKTLGIFGSVARGDDRPESDVDVLVEFDGDPTFLGYFGLLEHLEASCAGRIDLVTRQSVRPQLLGRIMKEYLRVA